MTIKGLGKRITAIILALTVVLTAIPLLTVPFTVAAEDHRVADPSTMDDWKQFFGRDVLSTHNVGGVWTDKSVFTDADAFDGTGITMSHTDNESFLVALSAIASNKTIAGHDHVPTDTVFAVDVSADAAATVSLVAAVNASITTLLEANVYNRVGVVVYADESAVLLPLGRYTAEDGVFLHCADGTVAVPDTTCAQEITTTFGHSVTIGGACYMQQGLWQAMTMLTSSDDTVVKDDVLGQLYRKPVIVLAANGAPTVASSDYVSCETADMKEDTVSLASIAFATQLTASYARHQVAQEYHGDCLFYTVKQEASTWAQTDVSAGIHALWTLYNSAAVGSGVLICGNGRNDATRRVEKSALPLSEEYADGYWSVESTAQTVDAFETVVQEIWERSQYYPTLVDENEDLSGYISFVDKIGAYMSVTDIKGIVIDNVLFSGALLSKNFVTGGGDLGTYDSPTSLGDELVWAVKARLGVDTDTARGLLSLAYRHGQLSYDTQTGDFSNYIGWYTNAAGDYLGFWYDGIETMPDPADPSLTDKTRPAFIMRSYGFLGAVDEAHGVVPTDMMYATVQIRENIATGEESVVFAVPAALIPTVDYHVTLDEDGGLVDLRVSGAEHPIRLVYEVALDEAIDAVSITELVDDGYAHINEDGTYDFYTNQFETDNSTGYGKVNTYSYFTPSVGNERYYYTEDSLVYADQNGTPYTGDTVDPHGEFYRAYTVYSCEDTLTVDKMYERISVDSLSGDRVERREDGYWYVVAGTVHHMLDEYVIDKQDNPTASLTYANIPFVDAMYTYYVGATLGNNGRLTITPETGITIGNTVEGKAKNETFRYRIESADSYENASYDAVLKNANRIASDTTVTFTNGAATVELKNGQTLYVTGMTGGSSYTVSEEPHTAYKVRSINGTADVTSVTLTVTAHRFDKAAFVHVPKGYGDVVIVNRIQHNLGSDYAIPQKPFEMLVDLGTAYAGEIIEASYTGDSGIASVKADENGQFTVFLKNTEQFALKNLIEGTTVTVTERNIPDGFVPTYYGAGVTGQNYAVVASQKAVSLIVSNGYTAEDLSGINVQVRGTLTLDGREHDAWTDEDVYTVELQKHNGATWETMATTTVDKQHQTFDFTAAMQAQIYTAPGDYSYQVLQILGTVDGVIYDRNIHTFTVVIGDPQMNGKLEVLDVISYEDGEHIQGNVTDGFTVTTDFCNTCSEDAKAVAVIDVNASLVNPSASDLVDRSGFRFGLYEAGEEEPAFVSAASDMVGEARIIASFDAEGTYTYSLREIVPKEPVAAMHYAEETYTVVINVTMDADGALCADVRLAQDGQPFDGEPQFVNRYEPTAASFAFPVTQQLVGRPLDDGEFIVEIRSGETVIATGTHDQDGVVTFDRAVLLDTVKDYYFDIVQAAGDVAGVTYDTFVYRLHAHVTDGGDGALYVHTHTINVIAEEIVFTNFYEAAPVKVTINGMVSLVGRDMVNDEFGFILAEQSDFGMMMTTRNFASGMLNFGALTFRETGVFRYKLSQMENATLHYIQFDDTVYDLVVDVRDEGDGQLRATVTMTTEDVPTDAVQFVNRYEPTAVAVDLVGKLATDGDLQDAEVALHRANDRWEALEVVATTVADEDGNFAFTSPMITQEGVYRYVVTMANSGQTVDGIAYDDEVYHVLYAVTDNHRGTLLVTKSIFDSNRDYTEVLTFINESAPPSTTTTTTTTMTQPTTTTTAVAESIVTTTTQTPTATTTTTAPSPVSPQTGDTHGWGAAMLVLCVSGSALMLMSTSKKTSRKPN